MTFDEALEARITPSSAIRELAAHGFNAWHSEGVIRVREWCGAEEEVVGPIGPDGLVTGADVLNWLGY